MTPKGDDLDLESIERINARGNLWVNVEVKYLIAEVRKLRALRDAPAQKCEWSEDETDVWKVSCKTLLRDTITTQNGLSGDGIKFCPYCGKPIEEIRYTEKEK